MFWTLAGFAHVWYSNPVFFVLFKSCVPNVPLIVIFVFKFSFCAWRVLADLAAYVKMDMICGAQFCFYEPPTCIKLVSSPKRKKNRKYDAVIATRASIVRDLYAWSVVIVENGTWWPLLVGSTCQVLQMTKMFLVFVPDARAQIDVDMRQIF